MSFLRNSSLLRRWVVSHLLVVFIAGPLAVAATPSVTFSSRRLSLDQLSVVGCSFPNHTLEAALTAANALGFAGVEIAVFAEKETTFGETYPWARVDRLTPWEKSRLSALVKKFRHVTTHLPYGLELRPLAADPVIRDRARQELHRALDDSGFWGASLANVHVISEPGVTYAKAKAELVALYRDLGDHAQRLGLRLAIETTRPYSMVDYLDLIKAIAHPNVGGTIDTGHMVFFRPELGVEGAARQTPAGVRRYNDLIAEFVSGLGPKLYHLHLDDVRAVDWREHFLPSKGIIDWPRLMGELSRVGYQGVMAAEILYYDGAADVGSDYKRIFTQRTRDGAPSAGLRRMRDFIGESIATAPAEAPAR